jgi:hypothetical protein
MSNSEPEKKNNEAEELSIVPVLDLNMQPDPANHQLQVVDMSQVSQSIPFNEASRASGAVDLTSPSQAQGVSSAELSMLPPSPSLKSQILVRRDNANDDDMDNQTYLTLDDSLVTEVTEPRSPEYQVGSELERVHSARSVDSNVTDKNSLFQRSDIRSIESYMSQILPENEAFDQDSFTALEIGIPLMPSLSSSSAGTSARYQPNSSAQNSESGGNSARTLDAFVFPSTGKGNAPTARTPMTNRPVTGAKAIYEVKLLNVSAWKLESTSVPLRSLNFKIAEFISYRESLLRQLDSLLQSLDRAYWQYAVQRISTVAKNVPQALMYEPVVLSRNRVFMIQQQVSVCLAHIRAISISICEAIVKLRVMCRKEIETTAPVSVFYHGENYLLKMWSDLRQIIVRSPSMVLYWLGFVPDPLIIPPERYAHDPHERWAALTKPIVAAIRKDLIAKKDREKRAAQQQLHRIRMGVQTGRGLNSPRNASSPVVPPSISTPQSLTTRTDASPSREISLGLNAIMNSNGIAVGGSGGVESGPNSARIPPPIRIDLNPLDESAAHAATRSMRRAGMLLPQHGLEKQILVENLTGGMALASQSQSLPASRPGTSSRQRIGGGGIEGNNMAEVLAGAKTRRPLEEWEQLREYCRHSWKTIETVISIPPLPSSESESAPHQQQQSSDNNNNYNDSINNSNFFSPPVSSMLPHRKAPQRSSFSVQPYPIPPASTPTAAAVDAAASSFPSVQGEGSIQNGELGTNSSSSEHLKLSIWTQNLDQAVDATTGTGQGFFSAHIHASPFVIEAALGFNEVWPNIFMVPVLPSQLRQRCIRLYEEVIVAEVRNATIVEDTRTKLQLRQQEHWQAMAQASTRLPPPLMMDSLSMASMGAESISDLILKSSQDGSNQMELSATELEALTVAVSIREQLEQRRWLLWHDSQQQLLEEESANAFNYNPSATTATTATVDPSKQTMRRYDQLRTGQKPTPKPTNSPALRSKKRSILISDVDDAAHVEPNYASAFAAASLFSSTASQLPPHQPSQMQGSKLSVQTKDLTAAAQRPALLLAPSPFHTPSSHLASVSMATNIHTVNLGGLHHTVQKKEGLWCNDEEDGGDGGADSVGKLPSSSASSATASSSVFLTEQPPPPQQQNQQQPYRAQLQQMEKDSQLEEMAAAIVAHAPAPPLTLHRNIGRTLRNRVDDERRVVTLNPAFYAAVLSESEGEIVRGEDGLRTSKIFMHSSLLSTGASSASSAISTVVGGGGGGSATSTGPQSMYILRPDRKRHRQREMDRLDAKYRDLHATNIQRIIRACLAKKRVRKMRNQRTWKRVLVKLKTLVRGFVVRLRQQREAHEAKVAIFIVRKQALARFRAAVTITRSFREMVNLRRLMKREPLIPDKLDKYGKPITSSEQRRTLVRLLQKKPSFLIAATDALMQDEAGEVRGDGTEESKRSRALSQVRKQRHGHHQTNHQQHHQHHHHQHRSSRDHHQHHHHNHNHHNNNFDPMMLQAPHLHPQLQLLINQSNHAHSHGHRPNHDDDSVGSSGGSSLANGSLVSMDSGVSSTNSVMIMQRIQHQHHQRKPKAFIPVFESGRSPFRENNAENDDDNDNDEDSSLLRRDGDSNGGSDDDSNSSQQPLRTSFFDQLDQQQQQQSRRVSAHAGGSGSSGRPRSKDRTPLTATEWAQAQLRLKSEAAAFVRKLQSQQVKPPPDRLRHSRLLPTVLGQNSVEWKSSSTAPASSPSPSPSPSLSPSVDATATATSTLANYKSTPSGNPNSRLRPFCRKSALTFMDFNRPASSSLTLSSSSTTSAAAQATGIHRTSSSSNSPIPTSVSGAGVLLPSLSKSATTPMLSSLPERGRATEDARTVHGAPLVASTPTPTPTPSGGMHSVISDMPLSLTVNTQYGQDGRDVVVVASAAAASRFAFGPLTPQRLLQHLEVQAQAQQGSASKETTTVAKGVVDTQSPHPLQLQPPQHQQQMTTTKKRNKDSYEQALFSAVARPHDVYQVPIGISTVHPQALSSSSSSNAIPVAARSAGIAANTNTNTTTTTGKSGDLHDAASSTPVRRGLNSIRHARLEAKRKREEAETMRMREALTRLIL